MIPGRDSTPLAVSTARTPGVRNRLGDVLRPQAAGENQRRQAVDCRVFFRQRPVGQFAAAAETVIHRCVQENHAGRVAEPAQAAR